MAWPTLQGRPRPPPAKQRKADRGLQDGSILGQVLGKVMLLEGLPPRLRLHMSGWLGQLGCAALSTAGSQLPPASPASRLRISSRQALHTRLQRPRSGRAGRLRSCATAPGGGRQPPSMVTWDTDTEQKRFCLPCLWSPFLK